jgi:hypothetical protein
MEPVGTRLVKGLRCRMRIHQTSKWILDYRKLARWAHQHIRRTFLREPLASNEAGRRRSYFGQKCGYGKGI